MHQHIYDHSKLRSAKTRNRTLCWRANNQRPEESGKPEKSPRTLRIERMAMSANDGGLETNPLNGIQPGRFSEIWTFADEQGQQQQQKQHDHTSRRLQLFLRLPPYHQYAPRLTCPPAALRLPLGHQHTTERGKGKEVAPEGTLTGLPDIALRVLPEMHLCQCPKCMLEYREED